MDVGLDVIERGAGGTGLGCTIRHARVLDVTEVGLRACDIVSDVTSTGLTVGLDVRWHWPRGHYYRRARVWDWTCGDTGLG